MNRALAPIMLVLLPLAAFLSLLHPATLDIGNPGWLLRGTDNGENALGTHAYLHDPAAGASLKTHLLNAPEGVSVLFTDSNPLVTLAAKPFAALLPADAQFIGPFVLLSLFLSAVFAWLLLRPFAPGPLALWSGVVLLAFPPTLANRIIHTNLMAHWTILAALWLFFDPKRGGQLRSWAPLIAVTALIHSYLLVMVGAIWASAMLARLVQGPARTRWFVLGQGIAVLAMVLLLAKWMGVGGQIATTAFGSFSMPLDALWNPFRENFSMFLPGWEYSDGRGFEGFQYMGAGGLLLVALAVAVHVKWPVPAEEQMVRQRARALVPALVILLLLAVIRLPLPTIVLTTLDVVRASGRLFWPVGYVLVLIALLTVYRLPAQRAGQALAILLVIQLIDVAGIAQTARTISAEAGRHRLYARTLDPRWDGLIRNARDIAFMPGDATHDLALFQEIAWRAAKAGRPLTTVYAARMGTATAKRLDEEEKAFVRGELVPGRLYIILPGASLPPAGPGLSIAVDNVTLIPASSPR